LTEIAGSVMAPKKSGQVIYLEPIGRDFMEAYPQIMKQFINLAWYDFCCNLQGYHEEVSMLFTKNFDGFENLVGRVLIYFTKHSIGVACHLPI